MKQLVISFVMSSMLSMTVLAEQQLIDPAATASQEWRSFIEPMLPVGERLVAKMSNPDDPQCGDLKQLLEVLET